MATTTDRVLIEILTSANMGGVASAMKGMAGLGLALGGVTVGMDLLFQGAKFAIDVANEHAQAAGDLTAAVVARDKIAAGPKTKDAVAVKELTKATKAHSAAVKTLSDLQLSLIHI